MILKNETERHGVGTGNKYANQNEGFTLHDGLETGGGDLKMDTDS